MSSPVQFFAFGFGSGLSPWAPGTFGTLAALPLYWFLLAPLPQWAYAFTVLAAALIGIWLCAVASRELGVHDHPGIVWDEFVGVWIALFALPVTPFWVLLGFLTFRVFDILKPWPIRWLDRQLEGGLGIMLDDIAAGVVSALLLQLLYHSGWVA